LEAERNMIRIAVTVVIVTLMVSLFGCGEAMVRVAELPTFEVGDKWIYEGIITPGEEVEDIENHEDIVTIEFTLTIEVAETDIVEGRDCWVMKYEGGLTGDELHVSTLKIDKSTLFPLEQQDLPQLEPPEMPDGLTVRTVQTVSYEFPDCSFWPLETGKEIKVVEHITRTTTYSDTGDTDTETETRTTTYRVEKVEGITVPAGTFMCFKIVRYNEAGKRVETRWYSEEAKWYVKVIGHPWSILELKSYSL